MKFTLSWLKDYLDTTATLDDITQKLTALGLEVESVEDPAALFSDFVVGHVISAEKHPDADKLKCLIVDNGQEKLKVVCGAPNAVAGMKGVFAPPGSYIPGIDVTLKKAKIRGEESNGMMCSERELCLSEEHDGIITLPDTAETGTSAATALGLDDPIIEINLTPNRGDCAGVWGVARDLAAAGLGTLKPLSTQTIKGDFDSPVHVSIDSKEACPLFIGRYIKDVKNGPAPDWLQKRLRAIGLRPISALVDITNYITVAYNRPLHVFDADKLKGHIHVRMAKPGEKLEALNDKSYELDESMAAVCDDSGVLGLGGIIGGIDSAVDEKTTNIYLEVALFDPLTVAKTGQRLQIDSDARYRFERSVDPQFAAHGAEIATAMILDLCGGSASTCVSDGAARLPAGVKENITYTPARLATLGGIDMAPEAQREILTRLGFSILEDKDQWQITIPSWRHDIDGPADIIEEILRIHGYDNIPAVAVRLPPGEHRQALAPLSRRAIATRRLLAARGMLETVTWSFLDDVSADLFGANANQNKQAMTLTNPISADLAVMRPSILPNLIAAAGRNADRGHMDACLFEVGNIYRTPEADGQIMTATGLRSGAAQPRHWSGPAREADLFDVKADALAVLESCGVNTDNLQITEDAPEWYHPGRSGAFRLGPNILAFFGEIHPGVLTEMKRTEAYAGFEVFLPAIPVPKRKTVRKPLLRPSPLQPVTRDFAFIMDENIPAEKLLRSIRGIDKELIVNVDVFDVYQGAGVEDGKKSIAVSVTLQAEDKTLTDAEITALCQKVTDVAEKQAGATLRQ